MANTFAGPVTAEATRQPGTDASCRQTASTSLAGTLPSNVTDSGQFTNVFASSQRKVTIPLACNAVTRRRAGRRD